MTVLTPGISKVQAERIIRSLIGGRDLSDEYILIWEAGRWKVGENIGGVKGTDASGSEVDGLLLLVRPTFDLEEATNDLRLKLRAPFNAGDQSGNWAPDFSNGPSQRANATGALQIDAVTGMNSGETINLRIVTNGNTVTFASADYEGPDLSFNSGTIWCSIHDFGASKLAVLGGSG